MKFTYKILLLLFLLPTITLGTNKKGRYTKTKTINKSFNVNENTMLSIANKYGNIVLESWNKNTIEITVTIKTNGDDKENTNNRLKDISVQFSAKKNQVKAITKIAKRKSSWLSGWRNHNRVGIEVMYHVKFPVTNKLLLNNDYGNITINEVKGSTTIHLDYGEFNIGKLLSSNNYINTNYVKNATIDYVKNAEITADYSSLEIGEAERIKLNTDYSNITINSTQHLEYNCDYGKLKVNSVNTIIGNSAYNRANVKNITEKGVFNTDYGNLDLEVDKTFNKIDLKTTYVRIKIKTNKTPFKIEANLNYSNFKYNESDFFFNKEIIKHSKKYYLGYYKSKNTNNQITINSSYGGIAFY